MARIINKLSAKRVSNSRRPGMYGDGAGLFLNIGPTGAKSWIFRYSSPTVKRRGKPKLGQQRDMGIGPLHTIGLADAREKAVECRKLVLAGIDPLEHRRSERTAQQLEDARLMTFDQCAAVYIEDHKAGWKNKKHAEQWQSTLDTYASPVFGKLPVQVVDTALVMKALQPIWQTKTETASRVRGRIESVLSWATTRGFRQGDNPARWRGHLENLLPARGKVRKVKHHPALPYVEAGAFVVELQTQRSIGALALEFAILTVARTTEATSAEWTEFDLRAKLWTVPAGRIKGSKEHRVPLSPRAMAILEELKPAGGKYVFPGLKQKKEGVVVGKVTASKPLSNMALLAVVERMNERRAANGEPKWVDPRQQTETDPPEHKEIVPHGFRSTFRDWAAERTSFPNEMAEMALAHAIDDKVEAAYRRGDLFDKRRRLMDAWADFCGKPAAVGAVVPLRTIA
jgi:integrase